MAKVQTQCAVEFSTMMTILARTTGATGALHVIYLENASTGLMWWKSSSDDNSESFHTVLRTDQYYKALYFWILYYLADFSTFHSDISSREICLSSSIIYLSKQNIKEI